jgi:hypothetical protein
MWRPSLGWICVVQTLLCVCIFHTTAHGPVTLQPCVCVEVLKARRFAAWVHGCRNGCLTVHPHSAFRLQNRAAVHSNITAQACGYVLAGTRWSNAMLLQCHVNLWGTSAAVQSSSAFSYNSSSLWIRGCRNALVKRHVTAVSREFTRQFSCSTEQQCISI